MSAPRLDKSLPTSTDPTSNDQAPTQRRRMLWIRRGVCCVGVTGLVLAGTAAADASIAAAANAAQLTICGPGGHGRWVTVNAHHVNVRTGWGTSYPVIGQQNYGDHLCAMGGHDDDRNPARHWWVFDYHGRDGWICATLTDDGWQ